MKIAEIEESENSHNSSGSNDEYSKKQANSIAPPIPSSPSKKENASSDEEMENSAKISYFKLYSFADSLDTIMIAVGAIAAAASGVSFPILIILFGNLIDAFGKESGTSKLLDEVARISLLLIYLATGSGFSSSLRVICWTISSERQTWRIRNSYLKSILRQEIALFDKDGNTGKVIGRLSVDTALIQLSIGEQMGLFIQSFAWFIGGYVIAFYQGWLLTLIMISSIPPLLIASVVMFRVQNKFSLREQAAYGEAANIVEQTISSIRTVVSFNGEKKAVDSYNQNLKIAESKSRRQEFGKGLSSGVAISFIYFGWALGVWYGGRLILNSGYTGGKVVNIILSVLTSSFALGQMSPCLSAFSEGKAIKR
ncbi:hypothetical protein ZOSMA_89G00200 [Zostera marina]|uniref:ABC transmembrane type-1 domain-containing protein n=1 Tax=Zostera marina TaxID=29655 RepID=A0A0K9NM60_ZOSMR|nr:hypothetical protein ZOSMA_89G00200 [Zostera marina]